MIENLVTNAEDYLQIAAYIIAAAAIIAAMTKTPTDDKWVGRLRKLVDVLAVNIGHAKNQEEAEKERKLDK